MSNLPPPGWYPDPWSPATVRWFDGADWTGQVAPVAAGGYGERYDGLKGASTAKWGGTAFLVRGALVAIQLTLMPVFIASIWESFGDALADPANSESLDTVDAAFIGTISQITSLLLYGCLAALCVWSFRATKNARLLGLRTQFSPGWAVGGWLIPLANLVMPYLVARDLFPEGHPARRDAATWWTLEISAVVLGIVAYGVAIFASTGPGVVVGALAGVLALVAGFLGARLTRSAKQCHTERARTLGLT